MAKNIEININNGSNSYEVLYPKTLWNNISDKPEINGLDEKYEKEVVTRVGTGTKDYSFELSKNFSEVNCVVIRVNTEDSFFMPNYLQSNHTDYHNRTEYYPKSTITNINSIFFCFITNNSGSSISISFIPTVNDSNYYTTSFYLRNNKIFVTTNCTSLNGETSWNSNNWNYKWTLYGKII